MNNKNKKKYFFVDESGDPYFFNRKRKCIIGEEGCSKVLILGFISTENPKKLRDEVMKLKKEVENDQYLHKIPSIKKTIKAFHAKDDCPEVREKFFKLIKKLNFRAEFVVARKLKNIFVNRHKNNPDIFYNDLISNLFSCKLHKFNEGDICFSCRGNKNKQRQLRDAIRNATLIFERKFNKNIESNIKIFSKMSSEESCLQIIDYAIWAVQRAFLKKEDRYFDFIKEKIGYIWDLYDFKKIKKSNNRYWRRNKFDIKKISPL